MVETAQEWKLRLFGGFELTGPNGASVRLPYRSAQALVAVLALNRDAGVSREELGRILWPVGPTAKRQENLRQTLSAVKASLGPELIEASRSHCRFAEGCRIVTDYHDVALRGSGSFMPGFEGEWFDKMGRRGSSFASARLLDSFLQVLMWQAEHDPEKLLGHMRDSHGLTFGLSSADRQYLLSKAVDDVKLAGWKKFFGTGVQCAGGEGLEALIRRHHQVVSLATANQDVALAVQGSSQVSLCYSWRDSPKEALSTIEWCLATATSCSDKEVWATATQMKGNLLVHAGRIDEGLALIERAEQLYRDPIDSSMMLVLRAHYLASVGRSDEASVLLDLKVLPGLAAGHAFVNIIWLLANAAVHARDKQPAEAIAGYEKVLAATKVYGDVTLTMIAEEELSRVLARIGETAAAEEHMTESRAIRRAHSRPYTCWDRLRLAS